MLKHELTFDDLKNTPPDLPERMRLLWEICAHDPTFQQFLTEADTPGRKERKLSVVTPVVAAGVGVEGLVPLADAAAAAAPMNTQQAVTGMNSPGSPRAYGYSTPTTGKRVRSSQEAMVAAAAAGAPEEALLQCPGSPRAYGYAPQLAAAPAMTPLGKRVRNGDPLSAALAAEEACNRLSDIVLESMRMSLQSNDRVHRMMESVLLELTRRVPAVTAAIGVDGALEELRQAQLRQQEHLRLITEAVQALKSQPQ